MKYTTLNEIKKFGPCKDGWEKLLGGLNKTQSDDEPLPYSKILEINGIADAIWSLRTNRKLAQAYAIACAEAFLPIFEKRRPGDDRPRQCIEAAKAYLVGDITIDVLRQRRAAAADAAAYAAAYAAYAAYADDAAYAAYADDAAYAAAAAAAYAAAAAAADAAYAAADAAAGAAYAAADAARQEFKKKIFLEVVG